MVVSGIEGFEEMTLEEKLKAIDELSKEKQKEVNIKQGKPVDAPVDPADATMCIGCQ